MSELKAFVARKIDDGSCDPVPCIEVYHKSEADKAIAHHKYKRCLGIAAVCFEKSYSTTLVKYDKESGYRLNFYDWWGKRWMELAEKFKETK